MRLAPVLAIVLVGCTPAARPYGIAAGLALSAVGAGLLIDAKTTSCPPPPKSADPLDDLFDPHWDQTVCELGVGVETFAGATILIPSAILLIAALASPSSTSPSAATAHPVPPPPPLDVAAPIFPVPRLDPARQQLASPRVTDLIAVPPAPAPPPPALGPAP